MLPTQRQQKIINRLNEQGLVQITELSQELHVSEMTIHRDLAQLEAEGKLRKVRGGAVPLPPTTPEPPPIQVETCFMCHSTPRSQTQMTLHLANGQTQRACCPHCGLHGLTMMGDQVISALVTDFLRGNAVNAQEASYVVNPDVTICCKPTVLAFQKAEDAQRFQLGFGGQLMSIDGATHYLQQAMQLHPSTASHEGE